jgi:HTH-type transcriptional regulator / antitoxin HipB
MKTKATNLKSLSELKDQFIGTIDTDERKEYEYNLNMAVIGKLIKTVRKERHLTQDELGKLIGVQKAQISKLENCTNSATVDTIYKVFKAMKAEINIVVKLENNFLNA